MKIVEFGKLSNLGNSQIYKLGWFIKLETLENYPIWEIVKFEKFIVKFICQLSKKCQIKKTV